MIGKDSNLLRILKNAEKVSFSGLLNALALTVSVLTLVYTQWSNTYSLEIENTSHIQSLSDLSIGKHTKILFKNNEVKSLHSSYFVLTNTGSHMIDTSMIVKQPELFIQGSNILAVEIANKFPSELDVSLSVVEQNSIMIDFDLINSGEFIEFRAITDGPIDDITTSARIKNIPQIDVIKLNDIRSIFEYITLYEIALIVIAYNLFLFVRSYGRHHAGPIYYYSREILKLSSNTNKAEFLVFLSSKCPITIKPTFLDEAIKQTKATNFRNSEQIVSLRDSLYYRATQKDYSITVLLFLIISSVLVFLQLGFLGYQFLLWLQQYF